MKNATLLIGLLCLFSMTSLFAQSADEAAIREVIEKESEAIAQRDFTAWKSCWHQDENSSLVTVQNGWNLQSWDTIQKQIKTFFENSPAVPGRKTTLDQFMINIQGDRAFVQYEETVNNPWTFNNGKRWVLKYFNVHNMLKVDGQWKNVNVMSALSRTGLNQINVARHLLDASQILAQIDRMDEATKIAAMTAELFPDTPAGYWGMGAFAIQQKDKSEALKHLQKAASLFDNEIPPTLKNLIEAAKQME